MIAAFARTRRSRRARAGSRCCCVRSIPTRSKGAPTSAAAVDEELPGATCGFGRRGRWYRPQRVRVRRRGRRLSPAARHNLPRRLCCGGRFCVLASMRPGDCIHRRQGGGVGALPAHSWARCDTRHRWTADAVRYGCRLVVLPARRPRLRRIRAGRTRGRLSVHGTGSSRGRGTPTASARGSSPGNAPILPACRMHGLHRR